MNRVTRRVWIMLVFIAILVGGMGVFLFEYSTKSDQWVVFTGSPHVYADERTAEGVFVDRDGQILLDTRDGRTYADDALIRQANLHWVGDRSGNISAPAVSHYLKEMVGYDPVDGVYSSTGADGQVELTISSYVQTVALEAMDGRKGTVAVYNYKTGEILCAVTTPNFDPDNVPDIAGDTTDTYKGVYVNRFIQSTYIPGSIFKIVTTAAALDCVDGIEDMTFECKKVYEFGVDKVTCERAHGKLNLKGAMANSCNCCYAQIAQLVGRENMMRYVELFGITDPVTFDGITTATGNYDVTDAAPVELAWSCIGQYTDQINPCRFMTFMGAIASGGAGVEPYLVSRVTLGEEVTYQAQPASAQPIMTQQQAETLREYMRNNVTAVYGDRNFPGLAVCAKSGTSQLGGGEKSNAMFAGFVADEAYPLAFIVVVENGGYGSSTCVPILSKVLAACKTVMDAA